MYFEKSMQPELAILNQHRINFKSIGPNFFKKPEILPPDDIESRVKYLLEMGVLTQEDLYLKEIKLSTREAQCALLYGNGFNQTVIARKMNVMPDQVARYLKRLRDKCEFKGRGHEMLPLIRKLFDLGYLKPNLNSEYRIKKRDLVFKNMPRNIAHNPNEKYEL